MDWMKLNKLLIGNVFWPAVYIMAGACITAIEYTNMGAVDVPPNVLWVIGGCLIIIFCAAVIYVGYAGYLCAKLIRNRVFGGKK